ncbi:hypothetical protein Rhe02_54670 [Rhizocola hellebori]|uniref:Uncharacterized protein n=1 Tax=Rhizocola hellebori TaxID=1392758 RepID=A0A8J3QD03_9ACTN|nr:hypothetical protein [Rhizocola hellebori]GIH07400.1 hypothetical protein Rhe02_54670 [Rhizocola hellebori]
MKLDSHGRVPYEKLSPDEREALHEWCQQHDIEHTSVPIDTRIERIGNEWEVDVFDLRKGQPYLVSESKGMAIITLRRPFKAELPWRKR